MAIGDDATAAGYPLVPDTGDGGEVKLGAQEINRTRDFIAQVLALIPSVWPISKGGTGSSDPGIARNNLGIYAGTGPPTDSVGGTVNGNIYFHVIL